MSKAKHTGRTGWPRGEWDSEPDRVQWRDEATGFECLIRRGGGGAWCGYVGVPLGHPWHGAALDHYPDGVEIPDVHGGVTYAAHCDDDPEGGVCHVPAPGAPEHLFWVGFDCAHRDDLVPERSSPVRRGTYRTVDYVRAETLSLARQAAAKAKGGAP